MRQYRLGDQKKSDLKVHVFITYRHHQEVIRVLQKLKGVSSRVLLQGFGYLRRKFWGRHLWGKGYLAVSSGNITDEMIKKYI